MEGSLQSMTPDCLLQAFLLMADISASAVLSARRIDGIFILRCTQYTDQVFFIL